MTPLEFIESITIFDEHGDIKQLFTKKYCYGFALMMKQQFKNDCLIIWDKQCNHAIVKIDEKFYDINGEYFPINYEMLEIVNVSICEYGKSNYLTGGVIQ